MRISGKEEKVMITIVGLGTGDADALTLGALRRIKQAGHVVLQTKHVPVADYLEREGVRFGTLDALYEQAEDFEALIECTVAYFADKQDCVFGILGGARNHALAGALKERYACDSLPGVAPGEYALELCGISAAYAEVIAADDIEGADIHARKPFAVTEMDSAYRAADVTLAFSRYYPHDYPVYWVVGREVRVLPLCDVPKQQLFSYACTLVLPGLPLEKRQAYTFEDLVDIMRRLRGAGGCPWDKEQTHETLRQYLLEESYEVMDAVDQKDPLMLYDELGDVLLQVVFHAQIAEEHAEFDARDVTTAVCTKMIHRHTHIFGEDEIATAEGVIANWEKIKRQEKGEESIAASMRGAMEQSALMRAAKVQKKAGAAGFDWEDATGALEKLHEELGELECDRAAGKDLEEEAGDLLFAMVNFLRLSKLNAEVALNAAVRKFINRFAYMEEAAKKSGRNLAQMTLNEQEELWQQAKAAGVK